jgi:hypothetical protein
LAGVNVNGPRPTSSTGRNRNSVKNIASKGGNIRTALNRDRTTGIGGGLDRKAPAAISPTAFDAAASIKKMAELRQVRQASTAARTTLPLGGAPDRSSAMSAVSGATAMVQAQANMTALALAAAQRARRSGGGGGIPQGPGGPLIKQLARGFAAAGDKRMAKFVRRNPGDIRTWLGQESGLDTDAISPPNNQGDPNYGLFQFARLDPGARPWLERFITQGGKGFTATPFQQAQLAARFFDLTPSDVRSYVEQIRSGSYKGWG